MGYALVKIAIIGTGRMGSLISRKLSRNYDLILIDKDLRSCGDLARELGAVGTGEYRLIENANYIITALSHTVMPKAVEELSQYISPHQVVINISTDNEIDTFDSIKGKCILAHAKIIGHAKEIGSGELPVILVGSDDKEVQNKVAEIFSNMGSTCFGDEKTVKTVNKIASEEGIKAAFALKERLRELNIPDEYISFAIRNVASGVMKAYALGDAGPFVKEIVAKLQTKK